MNEAENRVRELTQEVAKLRGRIVTAVRTACFHCEEYRGYSEERCGNCPVAKIRKEMDIPAEM